MKPQTQENNHWMVLLARDLRLADADGIDFDLRTSTADAWERVIETCQVPADLLAECVAKHFDLGLAELAQVQPHAVKLVPEKLARRYGVMPVREDDRRLIVATADPSDFEAEGDLAFACGRSLQFEIASPQAILDAQLEHYAGAPGAFAERLENDLTLVVEVLEETGPETVEASEVESAPVIKLTNFILSDAVRLRASDIHMEPGRDQGTVRVRVDGVMRTLLQLPMSALNRVITRVKIMGKLDIADRLRPQDGRARIQVESRNMELRISTVPTREAEKCVVRLLDHSTAPTLSDLELPPTELARIERLLANRNGLVIVTGPTGSGKTTTLYAAIRELATGEINIMTVENPVEYELAGITQIQVEPKQKVSFPSALRAILRQDPDVILVGEVRDLETGSIALQASMTGHFVLTTLHTNDAASAIERLLDLGIDRAGIAAALRGVIAQRLVRRLCENCALTVEGELTREEQRLVDRYGVKPVRRAVGCKACGKSGYFGRMALLEVLVATPSLSAMISGGRSTAEIERTALTFGMTSMLANGLARVSDGTTTLQEVARVLGSDADDAEAVEVPEAAAATPARVLVVDDDKVQRKVARKLLESGGFAVAEAQDGPKALQMLRAGEKFSLMVLDYTMPGLDGLEVLREVRGDAASQALPVIVATAQEDTALEARLMDEGADDYIRKPLDPARFTARVKAALRRAKV